MWDSPSVHVPLILNEPNEWIMKTGSVYCMCVLSLEYLSHHICWSCLQWPQRERPTRSFHAPKHVGFIAVPPPPQPPPPPPPHPRFPKAAGPVVAGRTSGCTPCCCVIPKTPPPRFLKCDSWPELHGGQATNRRVKSEHTRKILYSQETERRCQSPELWSLRYAWRLAPGRKGGYIGARRVRYHVFRRWNLSHRCGVINRERNNCITGGNDQ